MTRFTHFSRTFIAAFGALLISTACIGAAVGPATQSASAAPTTVAHLFGPDRHHA